MKIILLLAFLVSSSTWAAEKKGGTCVDIFLKLPPEADGDLKGVGKDAPDCAVKDLNADWRKCRTKDDCMVYDGYCKSVGVTKTKQADAMKWFEPCQKIKKDCKKTEYVKNFDCVKSLCEAKK
jgi:hypothetical protein